jgi:hypothetical protein
VIVRVEILRTVTIETAGFNLLVLQLTGDHFELIGNCSVDSIMKS